MEPFCTITPSRGGERPKFLDFCKHQISRMTIQPKESFFISHPPVSETPDLILRIQLGIAAAQKAGIDICYIIEDDDYYSSYYFEVAEMGDNDFVGFDKTIYYNIKNNSYNEIDHPHRSSLFCTGFRISALKRFSWPPDHAVFLDMDLWRYASRYNTKVIDKPMAVGIKHGIGITGGKGHSMDFPLKDPDWKYLKSKVDQEAYIFYKSL